MTKWEQETLSEAVNRNDDSYSEYKQVDEGWLDVAPAHWDTFLIKRGFDVQVGKMLQTDQKSPAEIELPYLKARHIRERGNIVVDDLPTMWFNPDDRADYALEEGDVLVAEGGDVGRAAIWSGSDDEILYQNAINRIRPRNSDSPRFLYYWLTWLKNQGYIGILCHKATIAHYTAEKVENTPILLPPVEEQRSIADFLDFWTGNLNDLIDFKQRLLDLLEEKRLAFLTQAVTTGLDSTTARKDPGVKSIEQIPEHWECIRLKFLLNRIEQGWSPKCNNRPANEAEWGVLKAGAVNNGVFHARENKALPSDTSPQKEYEIREGDLIMNRASGSPDLIGSIAILPNVRSKMLLCDKLYRLHVRDEAIRPDYLYIALRSKPLRHQIISSISGADGLANNIPQSDVNELEIPLPPIEEQKSIADSVMSWESDLDSLVDMAEEAIQLLQEKRHALITNAVTGQIDVTDWEPNQKEELSV